MRIELIATDGSIQKRLLWIEAASNGVYVSTVNKDGSKGHIPIMPMETHFLPQRGNPRS